MNWLRSILIAAVVGIASTFPTFASAQLPKPLDRTGRVLGFGWGDGYHTCTDSKIRLGANLPPKSFTAGHRFQHATARNGLIRQVGSTFYDQFDASNGRSCDGCGPQACDGAPITWIHGSHVTRGCDAGCDAAPGALSMPMEIIPPPVINEPKIGLPISTRVPEFNPFTIGAPMASAAAVKKHPIRPKPPALMRPRRISIPVSSKHPRKFAFTPPGIPESLLSPQPVPVATSTRHTVSSSTPAVLRPTHPDDENTSGALATEIISAAGVPSYVMEQPSATASAASGKPQPSRLGMSSVPTKPKVAARPSRLGAGTQSRDPILTRPTVEMATRRPESGDPVIFQPGIRR